MKAVKETVRKYYKYGNTPNVNIVGNPTISNGVASNFSNTNYLTLPTAFQPAANPWEIVLKVNMNNNGATGIFLGNISSGYFRLGFNNTNIVALYLSTNSTSWNIGQLIGTTPMINGVDYWIKATFDGAKYQIFLSTDGESYNLEGTLNSSSIPAYQSLSTLGAGNNSNNSTPQYTQGSIDLKNSYIKINDKEFWHGTLLEESTEADYDFYRDVDVYKTVKEIVKKYYKYESWTQPVLSSNGTIGVDDFAVSCSLPALTGDSYPRNLYLAFDGIIGNAENRFQSVSNTTNPQYIIVYSKNSLNIKSITFYQNTKETYYYIKAITIQGSNNGSDWTDLQTWTSNSYVANFTVDLSSNLEYYNYYRFYITNRAYYNSSNAYLMIQEISMTGTQTVESTESDYDFYVDKDIYKIVKQNNTYKAIKSYMKGQYYGN